jgi:hypothetical protein
VVLGNNNYAAILITGRPNNYGTYYMNSAATTATGELVDTRRRFSEAS